MFTGIVEEIGTIRQASSTELGIAASKVLEGTKIGDSIAVNGACLTVTILGSGTFTVGVVPETLRRTNLGILRVGDRVNLERSLGVSDRFGGHFVQGHVEGTGEVVSVIPEGKALVVRYEAARELMRYIVPKGFVAIDGVSLTVVDSTADSFTVSLIPHTQAVAAVTRRPGEVVNLETDIIGRYVERFMTWGKSSGVTMDLLSEHGFLDRRR
ncbi:MAG: riboflavin synthase [Dehalococcoidia bacterium]|nr:riboflavin synthase [Dehalococcoidia bacterium]